MRRPIKRIGPSNYPTCLQVRGAGCIYAYEWRQPHYPLSLSGTRNCALHAYTSERAQRGCFHSTSTLCLVAQQCGGYSGRVFGTIRRYFARANRFPKQSERSASPLFELFRAFSAAAKTSRSARGRASAARHCARVLNILNNSPFPVRELLSDITNLRNARILALRRLLRAVETVHRAFRETGE